MLKRLCNKLKVQPKGRAGEGTLTHKNVPLALDHSAASAPAARPSLQFSHFDEDTKRYSRPSQKEILRGQYMLTVHTAKVYYIEGHIKSDF